MDDASRGNFGYSLSGDDRLDSLTRFTGLGRAFGAAFRRSFQLLSCAAALLVLSGCGDLDGELVVDSEQDQAAEERTSELRGCKKRRVDAYQSGRHHKITVIKVEGKLVEINTAGAYLKMKRAAKRAGVHMRINSGFRTMAKQRYFYNCYLTGSCNGGNLAARPGYSNHQSGHALDLNTANYSVLSWLNRNGGRYGFKRTVPSENWHWEYWGGKKTPRRCRVNYSMKFKVKLAPNKSDTLKDGRSRGVTDIREGSNPRGIIWMKNKSNRTLKKVRVKLRFSKRNLRAKKYTIYKKKKGQKRYRKMRWLWGEHRNPGRHKLRHKDTLYVGHLKPGEKRKIVINFKAKKYSMGKKGHANLRAWVKKIKGVYGPAKHWGSKPRKNKFARRKRGRARVDILSTDEWQFNGHNKHDVEGWRNRCNRGHAEPLRIKRLGKYRSALKVRVTGDRQCIASPKWTKINADHFDQMILRVRSMQGPHKLAVRWKTKNSGQRWSNSRRVVVEPIGDGQYQTLVIPLGDHPEWKGKIQRIRLDMLEGEGPRNRHGMERHFLERIFFQSSATQKTSSKSQTFVNRTPMSLVSSI